MKRNSLPSSASSIESVNESRSTFRATSSARPGSWNGILPTRSALDPLRDDVPDDDRVAELGEAGPADEAGVPGAEERDSCHRARRLLLRVQGSQPFAIAIIVSFDWLSSSELTTQ
jgi:hypothetical protein